MRLFVRPTNALKPQDQITLLVGVALAAIFVLLAVGQLFSFEKFPDVVKTWLLPGGTPAAHLVAALLPTLEIFALPFLLSMRLSRLMRACSLACGWMAAGAWLFLSFMLAGRPLVNVGLLGATIPVRGGAIPIIAAILLVVGMAFVTVRYFTARPDRD